MVRSCVAKEQGWPEPVEPEPETRKSKSKSKSKSNSYLQEKPKVYSRQNRVPSATSEEWDKRHSTGQSSRGNGSVGGGVYKSSRSLGLRSMAAQPAAAEATERHQAVPRRSSTGVEQDGSEQNGFKSLDVYDMADKETGNEPEPVMAWPNTEVDVEVPPLPSRIPPFLR